MDAFRVGIIGCGRPFRTEGSTGFGMSRDHAKGYLAAGCRIVALADVNCENAKAFQQDIGGDAIYEDYREMLAKEKPDIVSVSTWIGLHEEMVVDCAEAGVRAVHCEKPIAPTWKAARRMVEACEKSGTQLSFNHQRRFDPPYVAARKMIQEGRIGELKRIEMQCDNLFDWGTHWFDMMFFYNGQTPAEWVLGQVDPSNSKTIFGVKVESQGVASIRFADGVRGLMMTGFESDWGAMNRVTGTEGTIEVSATGWDTLRVWSKGQTFWEEVVLPEPAAPVGTVAAVIDVVESLRQGREPELSGRKALMATELIFATYESARRGGRVALPLDVEDVEILAH
ncbi:MAG TPA: Gfo/Idh/MocA family oxidoreductase [Fimbriimonas sp.]